MWLFSQGRSCTQKRLGRLVGFVPATPKCNLQVVDTTLPWHPGVPGLPELIAPYCTTESPIASRADRAGARAHALRSRSAAQWILAVKRTLVPRCFLAAGPTRYDLTLVKVALKALRNALSSSSAMRSR